MLAHIVQYFRSCYQSDFRAVNLLDFFSTKVERRLLLDSSELLSGKLLLFPVSTEWGEEMWKELAIYSKEKTLYCCSFFLLGETRVMGKAQRVCAPLYLHTAELIVKDEVYYLSIDPDYPVINPGFLNAFPALESGTYERLIPELPTGFIKEDQVYEIETILKQEFPDLELSMIDDYPELIGQKELKQLAKKTEGGFQLVPAIGIGLIKKTAGSRGILNELEAIVNADSFSPPLQELFGEELENQTPNPFSPIPNVPVTLSNGQLETFKSAALHNLSMVVGPPGTGKSFTIAALAVNLLSQGKSVLVASRNMQAVNVIADKIEREFQLDGIVVRASKEDYKKQLQKRIYNLLKGIGVKSVNKDRLKVQRKLIDKLSDEINKLHQLIISREAKEMERGLFLDAYTEGFLEKIRHYFLKRSLSKESPIWQLLLNLEQKQSKRKETLQEYIKNHFHAAVFQALRHSRQEFQILHKALQARSGNRKERFFDNTDFRKILKAFPIWVTNTADVNLVLPLYKGLFDLVILDEASQCDIASSLPLLQRARKAVIVGDPKQLRHLSFLSGRQQNILIEKYQLQEIEEEMLDYRNVSLLDLCSLSVKSQNQVSFLDEHFRSMPDIIDFSNRKFYDHQLHVMTSCPASLQKKHVFLHQIEGQFHKEGYNKAEAIEVLKRVQQIIKEEAGMEVSLCQSIGILSPFRGQVDHLRKEAIKLLPTEDFDRHRLLIGTPYDFQGEEREVMFLTFALDNDTHSASFNYINRPDVFNVSITRARSLQHLLISFDPARLAPGKLLTEYLHFAKRTSFPVSSKSQEKIADHFFKEVKGYLQELAIGEIYSAYPIAGVEIDLVLIKAKETCCIDLVGYPGAFEDALPVERHQMLERVGIRVFSLPYSHWTMRKVASQKALSAFIGE